MAAHTFAFDIDRFAKKAMKNVDLVVRKVLFDVSTSLVLKSPVGNPTKWKVNQGRPKRHFIKPKGYVGGRFRANWQYATDYAPSGTLSDTDKSGRSSIARINAAIGGQGEAWGKMHWFANNLPYAIRLEHGWSKQAPAGMVKITAQEFTMYLNKAASSLKT